MRLSLLHLRSSIRRNAVASGEMIDIGINLYAVFHGEC